VMRLLAILVVVLLAGASPAHPVNILARGNNPPQDSAMAGYTVGQWQRINTTGTFTYVAQHNTGAQCTPVDTSDFKIIRNATLHTPPSRPYNSIMHDGNGKFMYWSGGHTGYQGNDVEVWDARSNTWSESTYDPDYWCNGMGGALSDTILNGRPTASHTMHRLAWDPSIKRWIAVVKTGIWSYNHATSAWERITADSTGQRSGFALGARSSEWQTAVLAFDPAINAIIYIVDTSGLGKMTVYRLKYCSAQGSNVSDHSMCTAPWTGAAFVQHLQFNLTSFIGAARACGTCQGYAIDSDSGHVYYSTITTTGCLTSGGCD
jgi:hypothetical protein